MVGLLFLAGCTSKPKEKYTARFYLEAGNGAAEHWAQKVKMPISGMEFKIIPRAFLADHDIDHVETAQLDLGQCLAFKLKDAGRKALYEFSLAHPSERIFLMINGQIMGFRQLDEVIRDGELLMFVEVPDRNLHKLASKINGMTPRLGKY